MRESTPSRLVRIIAAPKENPPEHGAAAAVGAVLPGPHKAPLVLPPIHAAQHERAGRDKGWERDRLFITGGQPYDKINTIAHHVFVNAII